MRTLPRSVVSIVTICWIPFVFATALTSVYLWSSGLPQVGDFAMVVWSAFTLIIIFAKRLSAFSSTYALLILSFVWYLVLLNLFWAGRWSSAEPLLYALYYIFNGSIALALIGLTSLDKEAARKFMLLAVRLAVLVSLLLLLVNFDLSVSRQTGGFNNPNQLGYTALLLFCMASILWPREKPLSTLQWCILFVAAIQAVTSFSISAILGLTIAGLGILMRHKDSIRLRSVLVVVVVSLSFMWGLIFLDKAEYLLENFQVRVSVLDRKTEDISGDRGYDRIFSYPEYLAFGAGEGLIERFKTDKELHSTFGTLIFSYGVPGSILFALFVGMSIGFRDWGSAIIISGPLVYSITHQGLRSTLFWILLVSMYLFKDEVEQRFSAQRRSLRYGS